MDKPMTRCRRCHGRLVCPRCTGRRGGQGLSPAKAAALVRARASRWRWSPGIIVTARARAKRTWQGEVVSVSRGRRGRRTLIVSVFRDQKAAGLGLLGLRSAYEATIKEALVMRVKLPAGQKGKS